MSSIDTKVGSPPMLRRTSPACRRRSTSVPAEMIDCHASSVNGLVTRGLSLIRETRIEKSNATSAFWWLPEMGAALDGAGVAASGI